jgi:hypothetical protein
MEKGKKDRPAKPAHKERVAGSMDLGENVQRKSLKERADERTSGRFRRAARKAVIAGAVAISSLAGYMVVNGITPQNVLSNYNSNQPPITAIHDAFKTSAPKENLMMIEYLDKSATTLRAEVPTVRQKGYVSSNSVLLNGLTDKDYWYQGGIETTHGNKIQFIYMVWDKENSAATPKIVDFDKKVNVGDKFSLSLEIKNDVVTIAAIDLNNGAKAQVSLDSSNTGSIFVGSKNANKIGEATSIFREIWLDKSFNISGISPQKIKLVSPSINSATFEIDKRVMGSGWSKFMYSPTAIAQAADTIKSVKLSTNHVYMLPVSADSALSKMRMGASSQIFYTTGDSAQ